MNFNHPFHTLYNPFMQGVNPFSPWILNNAMPFPPVNYPPPYPPLIGFPFHLNAHNNPFMIHQNNFYNSNFTSNTQQKPNEPFNEKAFLQNGRHDPNQKRVIKVQNQIYKNQTLNKNRYKIAEIIELEDSDQINKIELQQIKKQKNVLLSISKQKSFKIKVDQKCLKFDQVQKIACKNRSYSQVCQNQEQNVEVNENSQTIAGGLRRSKRNSDKYIKKIRKIIQEQKRVNFCPRKSSKQIYHKIKQQNQNFCEENKLEQELQEVTFQRAIMPTYFNFQINRSWKASKKENILQRAIN